MTTSQLVSPAANHSRAERLALNPALRAEFLSKLNDDEARALEYEWRNFWARPKQIAPEGNWRFWLVLAGRGFGKSKTGAQVVREKVERGEAGRIALIGETAADARDVMVEGESGIMSCAPPWFRPKYEPSKRRLTWPNGAIATTYSADDPEQLRGPQHDFAWGDELAKWRYAQACFDQLNFGLRLGRDPRAVFTTTPKPIPLLKDLIRDPQCVVTKGSTLENRGNLPPKFLSAILKRYDGTRLGRQELDAEILDDAPGALWKRALIDEHRVVKAPELVRIAVAIDPNVSSQGSGDEDDRNQPACGIVVVGLGEDGDAYVLADKSLLAPKPEEWGKQAVGAYHTYEADRIIGEVNNGGDLVESNIRAIETAIPFTQVRASRGKRVRAEPVGTLAEQGRIHHVGSLATLEDELCQWEPTATWSPNRLDALVWGVTYLMLGEVVEDAKTIRIRSSR